MTSVAVVSHDAGGAEILSSWVNHADCEVNIVVAGPAESIFRRKCPEVRFVSLDEALEKSTWTLCGTGWQSSFERHAIEIARAKGKKTVAFLDHWVNYRERFIEGNRNVLPDEIWVGDPEAQEIASEVFSTTPVVLQPNPYVHDLLAEIKRLQPIVSNSVRGHVLYVCEPVADHARLQFGDERHWGYTEYDALRFFLANLAALCQSVQRITIRPHPSERAEKYHWATDLVSIPIQFGGTRTLLEETLDADIIVGCESMAMVVGLLAGKRVISAIPPKGRICQLPHREIEHLTKLAESELRHG